MTRWRTLLVLVVFTGCAASRARGRAAVPEQAKAATAAPSVSLRAFAAAQHEQPRPSNERAHQGPPNHGYATADAEQLDDGAEVAPSATPNQGQLRAHPLDGLGKAELDRTLREDPASLGSVSLGTPSAGGLFNAVQMPADEHWELVDPTNAWGTRETIDYLSRAIAKVHEQFPNSPKLYIGHISARAGGHLAPHISHQAGRDVDIGYFYTAGARWYARAHNHNLDLPRTWAFVRALITETDVDLLLIDHSIQNLLLTYARRIGENENWLRDVFHGAAGQQRPLILHAKGHATHIHVRFYNPVAGEAARRVYDLLIKHGAVRAPTYYVNHTVKNGETLGMLSRKYRVSVKAIKTANGLRSNLIRARKTYRIPRSGGVRPWLGPVVVPLRRLPPAHPGPERPSISFRSAYGAPSEQS